jgi:hypothetical protein
MRTTSAGRLNAQYPADIAITSTITEQKRGF